MFHSSRLVLFTAAIAAALAACSASPAAGRSTPYRPQRRDVAVTTVPLLVKEEAKVLPFLPAAFAKGGSLDGKEVYGFSPSTITVVEGDTIHFTFINPEDDLHSFVLPDFVVTLPGNKTVDTTYVAKRAGIYSFVCSVQSHLPMMHGQLVVLSPAALSSGDTTRARSTAAADQH